MTLEKRSKNFLDNWMDMLSYFYFVRQQWPLVLFGFFTMFWGNLGQSFFISWYGAAIQHDLQLSASDYGLIYALATVCSAVVVLLVGGFIDRASLVTFVSGVAVLLFIAAFVMSQVSSPMQLAVAFFLLRLSGQGLMTHTAQTSMSRYFDSERGKALSLSSSGVPVGEVLLPLIAVALIAWLGWQQSWMVLAASVLLVYIPLAHWLLYQARSHKEVGVSMRKPSGAKLSGGRRLLLKDKRFWIILPAVLSGPVFLTGIFIQQGFILDQKGWSASWLAACFVAYGSVHWASSMCAGLMIDRFSARALLPFMTLPLFLALMCLSLLDSHISALVFMVLLGLSIGIAQPVIAAFWAEVYGTDRIGSVRSLTTSLMILSTALAPWLFGVLIDLGINDTQLFGGSAFVVLVAGLMVLSVSTSFSRHAA